MSIISNLDEIDTYPLDEVCKLADDAINSFEPIYKTITKKIFPMSNEMVEDLIGKFDLNGKRIIIVGSSGDQLFEYTLRGSNDITLMDLNYLSMYYIELKYAAIKTFSREEFIEFFYYRKKDFMSKEIYDKYIRHNIEKDKIKEFWDYILSKRRHDILWLFHHYHATPPTYLSTDEKYDAFRNKIKSISVKYYCIELSDFYKKLHGEYDYIDLSNILLYTRGKEKIKDYWDAVKNICYFLAPNGIIKLIHGPKNRRPITFLGKKTREIALEDKNVCIVIWENDKDTYDRMHGKKYDN